MTLLYFVHKIEDPERFGNVRDIASYLGLCPKRDQSGDRDKQLRITKAGDSYLRRLLVSAAQYLLGFFGKDCALRRFGLKLCERGGPRAKKKAVVAVARKLAVLMASLWKTGGLRSAAGMRGTGGERLNRHDHDQNHFNKQRLRTTTGGGPQGQARHNSPSGKPMPRPGGHLYALDLDRHPPPSQGRPA